jgi:hypothetical protein
MGVEYLSLKKEEATVDTAATGGICFCQKLFTLGVQNTCSLQHVMNRYKQLKPSQKRLVLKQNIQELETLLRLYGRGGKDQKIKILLVGSDGGGGHKSAGNSIVNILNSIPGAKDLFDIAYVEPFTMFSTSYWNNSLKKEDGQALQKLVKYKSLAEFLLGFVAAKKIVKNNMESVLSNPDIILQIEPVGTSCVKKIARELGAAHRVIPTDFKINLFLQRIQDIPLDDPSFRVDIALDDPDVVKVLNKRNIKNYLVVGYPVRLEILELAERLASEDEIIKENAHQDIRDFLNKQTGITIDHGIIKEQSYRPGDKTLLLMIGSLGVTKDRTMSYVQMVAGRAKELVEPGQTVHMFVAQSDGFSAELIEKLRKEFRSTPGFVLHAKGRVSASEVGMLMESGVTFCKGGGGTVAELVTMGSCAVFDMNVSGFVPWEKFAVKMFEKNGWGAPLHNSEDEQELIRALQNMFNTCSSVSHTMPANQFHLDWPKALLEDVAQHLCGKIGQ